MTTQQAAPLVNIRMDDAKDRLKVIDNDFQISSTSSQLEELAA